MDIKMEYMKLGIDEVRQHPQNVRIHGKRNLDEIKKSLSNFGQYKPILVQKSTMYILAGNGTHQAAKALGWTEMDCNVIDVDDDRAKAILIADNRSSELSEWDEKNLLDLLQDMDATTLDLTGYDDKELDKMLSFHEGKLFDDEKEKKPKEKERKQDLKDAPVSADDQISFVLMGYPFVLADPNQIRELRDLVDRFSEKNIEVRCETTFEMWNAITDVLRNATGQEPAEEPAEGKETPAEPADDGMETDRG